MAVLDSKVGVRVAACCLATMVSAGCAYLNQARDAAEPVAVPAVRHSQMLNPDAGRNRKVVAGLDGTAGAYVSEAYSTSFERSDSQKSSTEGFQGLEGLSTN